MPAISKVLLLDEANSVRYNQLTAIAFIALLALFLEAGSAIAGPVCRHAWPQAGMSASRIFVRADLIVGYDFFATVEACEYGSGHLVTCELRASNIHIERFFSKNPPTGNANYRTWNLPPMAKGGFAKGHYCKKLIHDNEDGKWVVAVSNSLTPVIIREDKAEVDAIALTYPE